MKWVSIREMEGEVRQRCIYKGSWEAQDMQPRVVRTGIELARGAKTALIWVPTLAHTKEGAEDYTVRSYSPVIEVTLSLVQDATPEEIAGAQRGG